MRVSVHNEINPLFFFIRLCKRAESNEKKELIKVCD